jgi:predicted small secreted protein
MSPRAALLLGTHGCALALGLVTFNFTIHQPHLKRDRALELAAEKHARKTEAVGSTIATQVRDTHETRQEEVRYVTRETIRAVPLYLPAPVPVPGVREAPGGAGGQGNQAAVVGDRATRLPLGFVRLHDYSALGIDPPVPTPSGEPLGSATSVDLSALAVTLGDNYGVCHGDRAEVKAWREWYAKEAAAWPVH